MMRSRLNRRLAMLAAALTGTTFFLGDGCLHNILASFGATFV
jgi:hypothetical protein